MAYKQNSPLPIKEGGTNLQTYATGDLIYSSATDVLSKLAVGSDGNILKLNTGVPVWESGAPTGTGWEFISSVTASTSANLNFTSGIDSTYLSYAFIFNNIRPELTGDTFNLRTSTNGGSSYDAGASDYGWNSNTSFDLDDDRIEIAPTISLSVGRSVSGILYLYNPSSTYSSTYSIVGYLNAGSDFLRSRSYGRRKSSDDVDAVRFFMQSGNITSGTIYMYGIATPS